MNIIINALCISIPEEFYLAFVVLFLVKILKICNHDYFDTSDEFLKKTIKIFFIFVMPISIITNLLLYLKVSEDLVSYIGMLMILPLILIILNVKKISKFLLVSLTWIISLMFVNITEFLIFQGVIYLTGNSLEYFKSSIGLKIMMTLFARIPEYVFILLTLFKKNSLIKTDVIKTIIRSKYLLIISTVYITINSIVAILVCDYVFLGKILLTTDSILKTIITLGIFIWCAINIVLYYLGTSLIQINERSKYKYGKELKV